MFYKAIFKTLNPSKLSLLWAVCSRSGLFETLHVLRPSKHYRIITCFPKCKYGVGIG